MTSAVSVLNRRLRAIQRVSMSGAGSKDQHPALVPPSSAASPAGLRPDCDRGELPAVRDLRVWCLHSCRPCREPAIHRPRLRRRSESHRLRMCRRRLRTSRSTDPRDPVLRRNRVLARPRTANGPRSPRAAWGRGASLSKSAQVPIARTSSGHTIDKEAPRYRSPTRCHQTMPVMPGAGRARPLLPHPRGFSRSPLCGRLWGAVEHVATRAVGNAPE